MGSERASKIRDRSAGRVCALCACKLDLPPWGWQGERQCDVCNANAPRHRVLMNFMHRPTGWAISFIEQDCRTPLRRKLNFISSDKVWDIAKRGSADLTSAARCDLEKGIRDGRGGVWLNLTAAQYTKLR